MPLLSELVSVIRSKNSGPFEITIDIIFSDEDKFNWVRRSNVINKQTIASLYNLSLENVLNISDYRPANAIKVTFARKIDSGNAGDRDTLGAQQHGPLLTLDVPEM
jgi:hypothetical protein